VTIKSPTNGRGLMNYGLTRMAEGDYATAMAYFERALPFTPNYSLLRINLGIAYGGAGRLADAEREFQTAIRLAPDDWRSHFYYGRWLRQLRRWDEALAELELAARQNPADVDTARELAAARMSSVHAPANTADALLERSLAAYRAGRFRECIELASAALKLRPGYAEAFNNVAAGHIALGEWDEGIAAAQEALRLNPDLEIARNNIAYARQQKQQRSR
jgi:protein O-mannosyl-transferase